MSRKIYTVTAIASLVLMLTALSLPLATVATSDPTDWYTTINGVLDSDKYLLYPYAKESIKVGLSKFGEFIDDNTNIGLEYAGARDPWAAPAGATVDEDKLPKNVWINGWYIDIIYNHTSWGVRNVWAGAMFADLTSYGGPWIRVDNDYWSSPGLESDEDFTDPGYPLDENGDVAATTLMRGGRKTNGSAVTEPMQVLYNGPRLFVAKLLTRIYDYDEVTGEKLHLVNVTLTVIFNKVKKEVIVLKDVKFIPKAKFILRPLTIEFDDDDGKTPVKVTIPNGLLIQFSDRAEWDLGAPSSYASYVHFYVAGEREGQSTCYNRNWTMLPTLPSGSIYGAHGPEPDAINVPDTYDVAQIISDDGLYVGWAAFWPSLSDWEADAGRVNNWWRALSASDPHTTDSSTTPNDEPFFAPLIVGEWDFVLSDEHREVSSDDVTVVADVQFRGVSVYGVTDLHDGHDADMSGENKIDSEVKYQLDEVFNPFDLWRAVRKDTCRHVLYELSTDCVIQLDPVPLDPNVAGWGNYCSFAERVIDLTTGELLERDVDYKLYANGTLVLNSAYEGDDIKVLWSSRPLVEKLDEIVADGVNDEYQLSHWPIEDVVAVLNVTENAQKVLLEEDVDYKVNTTTGVITFLRGTPYADTEYKVVYDLYLGCYEWIVVGKGSKAIDSAGAAMVSEAFDSLKNIPVRLSAFDRYDATWAPKAPYLMSRFATTSGDPRDDWYYFNLGAGYENDYRTALKDHWCTVDNPKLPISSSNIISVAGPTANLVTEYFNEFMPALFRGRFTGVPGYVGASDIMALTCWNKSTYTSGHAVIGVYKDINGTVGFIVWGWSGQDTYEACKWLWEGGIEQLQDAPRGLTAIVLEFDYSTHPTTVSVVECLGTISETLWTHDTEPKGGIHDP